AASRNDPANLENTYVYRGTDGSVSAAQNWLYGTATTLPHLPITERAQFLGDPRHCPYVDMKQIHTTTGGRPAANVNVDIGMGYNRYFDHFENLQRNGAGGTIIDGNATIASMGGTVAQPYLITASNRSATFRIDGTLLATIPLNLSTGSPLVGRSAANIASDLNVNPAFNAVATAASVNNKVYIRSKGLGPDSSVQFVTGVSNGAEGVLGFTGQTFYADYPGWSYSVSGTPFGVQNDGVDPATSAVSSVPNANWDAGAHGLENDENRIFEVWRSALMRTNAVYTTMTGFSYYYNGIGGEIGYDAANAFNDSIPVSRRPFDGTDHPVGGANWFEQSILDDNGCACGTKYIAEGPATKNSWWGMPWLGELYPDSQYTASWVPNGNLPTGGGSVATAGAGTFRRVLRENAPPNLADSVGSPAYFVPSYWHTDGTTFNRTGRRTSSKGSAAFFWAGTTTATMHHNPGGATASLRTAGTQIASVYNQPLDNPALSNRPFTASTTSPYLVNGSNTGDNPEGFLDPVYQGSLRSGFVSSGGVTSEFYHNVESDIPASGLLYLRDTSALQNTAFIVVNGLSQSAATGANFIANWSVLSLMESFFWGGVYSDGGTAPSTTRIAQLPQMTITSPNTTTLLSDPDNIPISWSKQWLRWDGRKYTPQYAAGFSESSTMNYYVMYSRDNGVTWKYCNTDNPATPGTRGTAADVQTGMALSSNWDVSDRTSFQQNAYLLRVEAYRAGIPLHYSYHQFRAFINR
ncbi:MAG: hypothetical protein ABI837_11210, partial [Acidobacteriota bacterium]